VKFIQALMINLKGKNYFADLGVDGMIILNGSKGNRAHESCLNATGPL
jgi:hypothetical protein